MPTDITPLWQSLSGKLRTFIISKVHDPALADDLLQEVFIRVHTRIDTLKDADKMQGWIYQIARNLIFDHFRKGKNEVSITELSEPEAEESMSDEMAEALQDMAKMMDSMPPEYCDVLCKSELGGMSLKTYAGETGISYVLARTRAFRARKMLKDMLMKCCHYQFDVYGTVMEIQPAGCCCCCDGKEDKC